MIGKRTFCKAPNKALGDLMLQANNGVSTPEIESTFAGGALFVPGADQDSALLANMITRLESKIHDISKTMDSHHEVDIAHPIMYIDSNGNHPAPFTIITEDDFDNGTWTTTNPGCRKKVKAYLAALTANNRYPLCVWPPHCIIGTTGHAVVEPVRLALQSWCRNRFKKVDFVTKGSNIFTEHYSAVKADVPDPSDPTTMLNTDLLDILSEADEVPISGQALSHCVANTVMDIADNFGEENIKKLVLLEDTCSNVPGFEQLGTDFVANMKNRGMRSSTSVDYLS